MRLTERIKQRIDDSDTEKVKLRKQAKWDRSRNLKNPKVLKRTHDMRRFNAQFRVRTLNERQRKAILMLADFVHDYPKRYIAQAVGVSVVTLWAWRNDPLFIQELDREITRRKSAFRLEAYKHFFRRIRRGNKVAIRDYFKITGDLKHQVVIENKEEIPESALDEEIQRLQKELGVRGIEVEESV
jgi:hypothetical protein